MIWIIGCTCVCFGFTSAMFESQSNQPYANQNIPINRVFSLFTKCSFLLASEMLPWFACSHAWLVSGTAFPNPYVSIMHIHERERGREREKWCFLFTTAICWPPRFLFWESRTLSKRKNKPAPLIIAGELFSSSLCMRLYKFIYIHEVLLDLCMLVYIYIYHLTLFVWCACACMIIILPHRVGHWLRLKACVCVIITSPLRLRHWLRFNVCEFVYTRASFNFILCYASLISVEIKHLHKSFIFIVFQNLFFSLFVILSQVCWIGLDAEQFVLAQYQGQCREKLFFSCAFAFTFIFIFKQKQNKTITTQCTRMQADAHKACSIVRVYLFVFLPVVLCVLRALTPSHKTHYS